MNMEIMMRILSNLNSLNLSASIEDGKEGKLYGGTTYGESVLG